LNKETIDLKAAATRYNLDLNEDSLDELDVDIDDLPQEATFAATDPHSPANPRCENLSPAI